MWCGYINVVSCDVVSCDVVSCNVVSCNVVSCDVVPQSNVEPCDMNETCVPPSDIVL